MTAEVAGATPDHLFSYYVGFSGTNQTFRYGDQYGGVSDPLYFYPLSVPTNNNVYNILDGSGKYPRIWVHRRRRVSRTLRSSYSDLENVINLHFGIPHRNSPLRDDVQALYVTGGIAAQFYSSAYDVWYTPSVGVGPASAIPCRTSTHFTARSVDGAAKRKRGNRRPLSK